MPHSPRYPRARKAARALRRHAALSLSLILLLTTSSPVFAQTRTAVRLRARESGKRTTPTSRKSGREQDAQRAAARARAAAGAQDASPSQVSRDGETVGMPWAGERGVRVKTKDIMRAQAAEDAKPRKALRVGKGIKRKEKIDRSKLPQNPDSPAVASWPAEVSAPAMPAATERGRHGLAPKLKQNAAAAADAPPAPAAPQTVSTPNFLGATLGDTGAFPPDTMGAAGPTQFVVFVNGRVRTFNKTTGVADGVVNADSDVFFSSVMTPVSGGSLNVNFTSDARVRYDRLTRRWVLIIIDVPSVDDIGDTANRLLIAVSDAASNGVLSAGTVWTYYFVQQDLVGVGASTGEFLDYPTLGIDEDALYVGGNMFNAAAGSFANCTAFVIRKSSILSGGPVVTTAFRGILPNGSSEGAFTPQGVDNYATGTNEGYFIGVSNAAFGRLILRRVTNPDTTPTISADVPITVSATSFPITVDHLGDTGGTNGNLDALDDRLFAAHIRGGRLWTSHNIAVTAAGVASNSNAARRNGVRWYELVVPPTTGTPTVNQSGTVFDTAATVALARQFWIPSVMVSGQGHAAFGYSTAGTPYRADAATNGRLRGDTLGTTGTVALYTASTFAYNPPSDPGPPRRWGDYSYTSLDPKDDMTMWTIQQFTNATNTYGVQVVKLLAPAPATPTAAVPVSVPQNDASENVVITGTSVAGSEFYDPGPDIAGAEPFNHITATVTGGVTVNSVTYNSPTQVTLNVSTVGATLGPQNVTVTNPDGQSMTGLAVITVGAALAVPPTAGQVVISEFRFRGAAGATDEFTELYNKTDNPLDISGCTLQSVTAGLVHTVPGALGSNTTVLPARGHYLITGAGYSLAAVAASNGTQTGIGDASSIGFFAGTPATAANRIDSVGFNNTNPIFFEGTPLTPATGITANGEYSFMRKLELGTPQDTGNNDADFVFVSTTGGTFSTRVSRLGAPGPENLTSPVNRTTVKASLIDNGVSSSATPNRVRTQRASCPSCDNTKSNLGTMEIRRRFTNNTGVALTRLRFRIVDITTLNNRLPAQADLRALNATGNLLVSTTGGNVTVESLTLEPPSDAVTNGGGYNSTLAAGTITAGTPIAPGASINVNFLLGVQLSGDFRFFVIVEALP